MIVKRICQHCGLEFQAQTSVTKYCGDNCAKRAYKARKRTEKIEASNEETRQVIQAPIVEIQAKDFLSIGEVGKLFQISRSTVWRLSKDGKLKTVKIGKRKFVSRAAINRLFE